MLFAATHHTICLWLTITFIRWAGRKSVSNREKFQATLISLLLRFVLCTHTGRAPVLRLGVPMKWLIWLPTGRTGSSHLVDATNCSEMHSTLIEQGTLLFLRHHTLSPNSFIRTKKMGGETHLFCSLYGLLRTAGASINLPVRLPLSRRLELHCNILCQKQISGHLLLKTHADQVQAFRDMLPHS